jgi:hypothetical protein
VIYFQSVWIIVNIIYFTVTYFKFELSDEYFYTRKILGVSISVYRYLLGLFYEIVSVVSVIRMFKISENSTHM